MNEKREISVLECIWSVVENWRKVLLSAILFSLLFGILQYTKSYQEMKNMDLNAQTLPVTISDVEEKMEMLSEPEKSKVKMLLKLATSLSNHNNYIDTAALMKLNAYDVERTVLQYSIICDKDNSELFQVYRDYVMSEISQDNIAKFSNKTISSTDINDMITVSQGRDNTSKNNNKNYIEIESKSDIQWLYVVVRGFAQEDITNMTKEVKNIIDSCNKELQGKGIVHSLNLISENNMDGPDEDILSKQNNVYIAMYDLYDRNSKLMESMSEEGKAIISEYRNAMLNDGIAYDIENEQINIAVSKKWILLGLIFGVIFMCILEVLRWLDGGRLNYANELSHNYNIHVLGKIKNKKVHRFFPFVDSWIYKIKNKNKRVLTREQEFQLIYRRILICLKKKDIEKIYLIGTRMENICNNDFVVRLTQELRSKDIELIAGDNIEYNSQAYEDMLEIKNVILWETTKQSMYQEISNEIEICAEQNIDIIGAIVVES